MLTPATRIETPRRAAAWLGEHLLTADDTGVALYAHSGELLETRVPGAGARILTASHAALLVGAETLVARVNDGLELEPLCDASDRIIGYLGGSRVVRTEGRQVVVADVGRDPIARMPVSSTPVLAAEVLAGTLALVFAAPGDTPLAFRSEGALETARQRTRAPDGQAIEQRQPHGAGDGRC